MLLALGKASNIATTAYYLLIIYCLAFPKLGTYADPDVNKNSLYKLLTKLRATLEVNIIFHKIEDLKSN